MLASRRSTHRALLTILLLVLLLASTVVSLAADDNPAFVGGEPAPASQVAQGAGLLMLLVGLAATGVVGGLFFLRERRGVPADPNVDAPSTP